VARTSATLELMTGRVLGRQGRFAVCPLILALGLDAQHSLSVQSNLVSVPVTVTDRNGKPIIGLDREHFAVTDESEPREILAFSRQEGAVSMGFIVDMSGSMQDKQRYAASAVRAITAAAGPGDEAFLLTFGDQPEMRVPTTRAIDSLADPLISGKAHGKTALIDAVYRGIHEVRSASHRRKALVVISDGGDNHSRFSEAELQRGAIEGDVQIYAISLEENARSPEEKRGTFLLRDLAALTGGAHFTIRDRSHLPGVAAELARAMREVYVLSFKPPAGSAGKWRQVRVSVNTPSSKTLRVAARSGYYAPE